MSKKNEILKMPIFKNKKGFRIGGTPIFFDTYEEASREQSVMYFKEVLINYMKHLRIDGCTYFYCEIHDRTELDRYLEGLAGTSYGVNKKIKIQNLDNVKFPCYVFDGEGKIFLDDIEKYSTLEKLA